jgi:hypothetical protein
VNYIVQKITSSTRKPQITACIVPVPRRYASDDQVQIGPCCQEPPELPASAIVLPSVLPAAESNVLSTRHPVSAKANHRFVTRRSHVKKFSVYATTAVGATAVAMAFFGTGIAAADDYAGQKYSDASSAISDAGKKAVIASRAGDTLADDDCIVTHSQSAPWIKGDSFAPVTDTVLVYLNCNATVATAKDPGNSAGSPEGRAAIAAAQKQAESGGSGS